MSNDINKAGRISNGTMLKAIVAVYTAAGVPVAWMTSQLSPSVEKTPVTTTLPPAQGWLEKAVSGGLEEGCIATVAVAEVVGRGVQMAEHAQKDISQYSQYKPTDNKVPYKGR